MPFPTARDGIQKLFATPAKFWRFHASHSLYLLMRESARNSTAQQGKYSNCVEKTLNNNALPFFLANKNMPEAS